MSFTLAGVGTQGKPESVCATLWDAGGVVGLLALLCLLHLQWIQVTVLQLSMKTLRGGREGARVGKAGGGMFMSERQRC